MESGGRSGYPGVPMRPAGPPRAPRALRSLLACLLLLTIGQTVAGAGVSAPVAVPAARDDFNGDGFADLAVGAQQEDIGTAYDAGAVNVIYGSAGGLTSNGNQFWSQNTTTVKGTAEAGDLFGTALASGDFNGDGYADLAVGVPGDQVGSKGYAGGVNVLYGSASGLDDAGNELWTEDSNGVPDAAENSDALGSSLTAGDFNGDGFADLAAGAPGEKVSSKRQAGAAIVIYGSAAGLASEGSQLWSQDSDGIGNSAEEFDGFANALIAGDYDHDGFADLAVGIQEEDLSAVDTGAVQVIQGSANGLAAAGQHFWTQDSTNVKDKQETGDVFGSSLTSCDFNGDGASDLAIGVLSEGVGSSTDAGAVNVLYGSGGGLDDAGNQFWNQDSNDIQDSAEVQDYFGRSLAAGDFDGDGFCDLAVGVNRENLSGATDAGSVNVIYGTANGLAAGGDQFWTQDSSGISDSAEGYDQFGWSVWAGDVNGDGFGDLAAGVPLEGLGGGPAGGAVNEIHGSGSGLSSGGEHFWTQDSTDIADQVESGDQIAWTLG
jgi:hypothetical protein